MKMDKFNYNQCKRIKIVIRKWQYHIVNALNICFKKLKIK